MFTATLEGDFGKLEVFGKRIGNLGSPSLMRGVAKEIADEALFQAQVGFSKSSDPYDKPWAAKKFPDGRAALRGKTGKLMRSFVRLYTGPDAAIIGNRAPEVAFAQSGTGIFGPNKSRIYPKKGRFLRIPLGGNRFAYASSVEGSQQRMVWPKTWNSSPRWGKAFRTRVNGFLRTRLSGR